MNPSGIDGEGKTVLGKLDSKLEWLHTDQNLEVKFCRIQVS